MKDKKWRFIEKTLKELQKHEDFLNEDPLNENDKGVAVVGSIIDLVVTSLQALANDDQEIITIFVYDAQFGERDVVVNIDSPDEFWIQSYSDLREIMELTYGL